MTQFFMDAKHELGVLFEWPKFRYPTGPGIHQDRIRDLVPAQLVVHVLERLSGNVQGDERAGSILGASQGSSQLEIDLNDVRSRTVVSDYGF
jgi:hypothetical protein